MFYFCNLIFFLQTILKKWSSSARISSLTLKRSSVNWTNTSDEDRTFKGLVLKMFNIKIFNFIFKIELRLNCCVQRILLLFFSHFLSKHHKILNLTQMNRTWTRNFYFWTRHETMIILHYFIAGFQVAQNCNNSNNYSGNSPGEHILNLENF